MIIGLTPHLYTETIIESERRHPNFDPETIRSKVRIYTVSSQIEYELTVIRGYRDEKD